MFTAAIFFLGNFYMCASIEQQHLLWQPGPPDILWKWASMLTKLARDGECRLAVFHAIRNFLANDIYNFSRLSHQHLVFHFPHCVCFLNWTGQSPNLTAFTSKMQVFYRLEWTKGSTHENEFWQFSNAKMRSLNKYSSKSRCKKKAVIALFSYLFPDLWCFNWQKLCPFCNVCWYQQKI